MKYAVILVLIISLLASLGFVFLQKKYTLVNLGTTSSTPTQNASETPGITFPTSNDQLILGQTYTLKWNGGDNPTDIFLINIAAESQGVSVSIFDRVYHVENTGSYSYTIPANLPPGNYKFEIGSLESQVFPIVASSTNTTTFCNPTDLQANISLSAGAGNVYGTLNIKNTSSNTCQIVGSNFPTISTSAQNITTSNQGSAGPNTFSISPGQTIYSQIHYPNGPQCDSSIKPQNITINYKISSSSSIEFTNQGSTKLTIEACSDSSQKTQIDIWPLSSTPITQ